MERWIAYADGGCRRNPGGPCGAGAIIGTQQRPIAEAWRFFETGTNNTAEYDGLILALELAIEWNVQRLDVFMDSKLVVCQMQKIWRTKKTHLIPYRNHCLKLASELISVTYNHIPREQNGRADALASKAMRTRTDRLELPGGGFIANRD